MAALFPLSWHIIMKQSPECDCRIPSCLLRGIFLYTIHLIFSFYCLYPVDSMLKAGEGVVELLQTRKVFNDGTVDRSCPLPGSKNGYSGRIGIDPCCNDPISHRGERDQFNIAPDYLPVCIRIRDSRFRED